MTRILSCISCRAAKNTSFCTPGRPKIVSTPLITSERITASAVLSLSLIPLPRRRLAIELPIGPAGMLFPKPRHPIVVHYIHIGKIFGVAAAWIVEIPKDVRAEDVAAELGCGLPAFLFHEIAALQHFIEAIDLEGDVIEAAGFWAREQEKIVMILRASTAEEIAQASGAIAQPEAEPL